MDIRSARYPDAEAIIDLDPIGRSQRQRANFIHRAISARTCHVAEADGRVVGYGVLEYSFFENGFISMLCVHPDHRRRGVGGELMRYMEKACRTPKLFITTNESNAAMRALLEKLEYRPSGRIENLDETDTELVFYKRVK